MALVASLPILGIAATNAVARSELTVNDADLERLVSAPGINFNMVTQVIIEAT